jgi:hypothetical protein
MTGSVFGGLWVSFSQNSLNLSPSMLVDAFFFAPMTGLGEQQIDADHLVADFEK